MQGIVIKLPCLLVFGPFDAFEHDSSTAKMITLEERISDFLDLSPCRFIFLGGLLSRDF